MDYQRCFIILKKLSPLSGKKIAQAEGIIKPEKKRKLPMPLVGISEKNGIIFFTIDGISCDCTCRNSLRKCILNSVSVTRKFTLE